MFSSSAATVCPDSVIFSLAAAGKCTSAAAIGRYPDIPFRFFALRPPPPALYFSGNRMVGRFDEVESFGKVGIHDDPPEGRFRGIGSDACKVLVKPYQQVAEHHHVVLRIHIGCGRIEIPELPDRRGAMRYHITPTRVGLFEAMPSARSGRPMPESVFISHWVPMTPVLRWPRFFTSTRSPT